MIGNDIVDLKFAKCNSRWKEQRFSDKLFKSIELEFILKNEFRFLNIWRLWTMKESAYKIVSRTQNINKFNPKAFECDVVGDSFGLVTFRNQVFKTNTIIYNNYIYSTANTDANVISSMVFNLTEMESRAQSLEMKTICIDTFSKLKSIPTEGIIIKKNKLGVPQIFVDNRVQQEYISITHHGAFGGMAIAM